MPMTTRWDACCLEMYCILTPKILQLDFNTQSSSHWDGLRHFPYKETGQFYNGVTQEELLATKRIGIQSKSESRYCIPHAESDKHL
jgi:hypothetical protein